MPPRSPGSGGPDTLDLRKYTDAETGFQYLRARYYDPATGQFLSRDPIEAVTRSAYGYVGGNPLKFTDPSGLDWWDPRDNVLPAAENLWNSPVSHDWGTFGAGVVNLALGSYKVYKGTTYIRVAPLAGVLGGPELAAAFYDGGGYQLVTGTFRVARGVRQVGTGPRAVDCTVGGNITQFGKGIAPGGGILEFLGGLPWTDDTTRPLVGNDAG